MAKQEKRQPSALIVGKSAPGGTWRKYGAFAPELRASLRAPEVGEKPAEQPVEKGGPMASRLGPALNIRQAASLIGCSPWTVRQKLIPMGLPHLRFGASGKITFYRDQVVRWIESQQKGGHTQL